MSPQDRAHMEAILSTDLFGVVPRRPAVTPCGHVGEEPCTDAAAVRATIRDDAALALARDLGIVPTAAEMTYQIDLCRSCFDRITAAREYGFFYRVTAVTDL